MTAVHRSQGPVMTRSVILTREHNPNDERGRTSLNLDMEMIPYSPPVIKPQTPSLCSSVALPQISASSSPQSSSSSGNSAALKKRLQSLSAVESAVVSALDDLSEANRSDLPPFLRTRLDQICSHLGEFHREVAPMVNSVERNFVENKKSERNPLNTTVRDLRALPPELSRQAPKMPLPPLSAET